MKRVPVHFVELIWKKHVHRNETIIELFYKYFKNFRGFFIVSKLFLIQQTFFPLFLFYFILTSSNSRKPYRNEKKFLWNILVIHYFIVQIFISILSGFFNIIFLCFFLKFFLSIHSIFLNNIFNIIMNYLNFMQQKNWRSKIKKKVGSFENFRFIRPFLIQILLKRK